MKRLITFTALAVVVAGCATTMSGPPNIASVELNELPPELQAIASYTYGDSRAGILAAKDWVADSMTNGTSADVAASLASLLHSPASRDAKQFACRQLVVVGTENEVPAIAALLYDPATADMARYALQPIKSPAVTEALLTALDNAPAETHIGIVNTLGARGDESALPTLRLLATGIDGAMAEAAQAAINRIEG